MAGALAPSRGGESLSVDRFGRWLAVERFDVAVAGRWQPDAQSGNRLEQRLAADVVTCY